MLGIRGFYALYDGLPADGLVWGTNSYLHQTAAFALGFFVFEVRDSLHLYLACGIFQETLVVHHSCGVVLYVVALATGAYHFPVAIVLIEEMCAPMVHLGWVLAKLHLDDHWVWDVNQSMLVVFWVICRNFMDIILWYYLISNFLECVLTPMPGVGICCFECIPLDVDPAYLCPTTLTLDYRRASTLPSWQSCVRTNAGVRHHFPVAGAALVRPESVLAQAQDSAVSKKKPKVRERRQAGRCRARRWCRNKENLVIPSDT